MSRDTFLDELISTLGADVAQRGSEVPERYWTDWSGTPPERPLALVRPRRTDDVSRLLQLCSQHGVPVVPQGGRTGLAGGAVPISGAVALSLERMSAIEQFDHMFRTEIRGTTPALAAASFPRDDADSPYPGAFCNPT